jgi:hypothetical protein
VKTFYAEFFTVTLMINAAMFSYRYTHVRKEIELFLLSRKIASDKSFFEATLHNLPESVIIVGKNS